ncbi:MAG: hypothetical protein KH452_05610 [Clostridiales bacterium]|nr:hypothetical protein [Clostridiales bacterium]
MEEKMQRAARWVKLTDRFRILLLILALLVLLGMWLGEKFFEGAVWYGGFYENALGIVSALVAGIFFMVLLKFFFYNKYRYWKRMAEKRR